MATYPAVAMIEPVCEHRGMKCYDFSLCAGLTKYRVPVTLYTCDETTVPTCTPFEVKRTFVKVFGEDPKLLRGVRHIRGSWKSLIDAKSRGITIAHFHFFHGNVLDWIAVRLAKLLRMYVVITVHDVISYLESQGPDKAGVIYRCADLLIVHNDASRHELITANFGVDTSKIRVISSGNYATLTNSDVSQSEAREALGLPADVPLVLFFGQIKKTKGLDLLLNAFASVRRHHHTAKLLIAGKVWHHEFARYQQEIDRLGLADDIISRLQFIEENQVSLYFRAATVAVLPYRKIYQSAVLFSAMSARCPVIVSDLPGFTDIVEHGRNGLIFKDGNIDDLAGQLNNTLSNPIMIRDLAQSGFRTMIDEFSWETVALRTKEAYESLWA